MAASASDAHPYPIYNARFRAIFPLLDADGDLVTGASTPDTEISQDCGTFADATNEMTEIATNSGMYYIDLIATEMDTKSTTVIAKSATAGMKTTPLVFNPVRLPVVRTGTAQAGAASTITLDSSASAIDDYYAGCYVNITNNSPANAQGQARMITAYNGSTKVATVEGTYGTNPSSASTFEVLATERWIYRLGDIRAYSGTAGTFSGGRPEVNTTHAAGTAWGSGAITAASIAADAITAAKIADGAIDAATFAAGAINAAAIAADAITDAKVASDVTIASVTGAVGSVTGNVGGNVAGSVGSVTATVNANVTQLSGDSIAADNAEAFFDGTGYAGTNNVIPTVTTLTNLPAITAGWLTAAGIAADAITAAKVAADVGTEIGTAVWATTTRQLTGTQTFNLTGDITGNLSGSVASVTGNIAGDVVGNIEGNVEGSVGTVNALAANVITAASIAADAGTEIGTAVWATTTREITGGTIGTITGLTIANVENATTRFLTMIELDGAVYRYTTNALEQGPGGGSAPTAAAIADAVWDEALSGHLTAGSTGLALNSAGSAGDPWSTAIPGAYASGTAGYLVGTTIPGLLQDAEITLSSPVSTDGETVTIIRGDDYNHSTTPSTSFRWTFTGVPSLTGATVLFKMAGQSDITMTVSSATTAYMERTDAQTTALTPGRYRFDIVATLSGGTVTRTLVENGTVNVVSRNE